MDKLLFSSKLKIFDEKPSPSIQCDIEELKAFLQLDSIDVFHCDEENVALKIQLDISLPSKGNFNDIDIRKKEPILVVFNLKRHPNRAPRIQSNRKDFPSSELSHLYSVKKNKPPTLCLVRENLDEWYSNRRISDLIIVAQQWFSKAANGILSEDGDEFEPIRLESYRGYFIYKNESFDKIIKENKRSSTEYPFAYLLFDTTWLTNKTKKYNNIFINEKDLEIFKALSLKVNENSLQKADKDKDIELLQFGLLIWSEKLKVFSNYNTYLPKTYKELVGFAKQFSIPLDKIINVFINENLHQLNLDKSIPITIGIKRPKKLVGFKSDIEFLHFTINSKDKIVDVNSLNSDAEVYFSAHREPLSSDLAKTLSVNENIEKSFFIGAGALGSKLIFHYARSGNFNLKVIDHDKFSPHNLVRHDLFMESSGKNKANAVISKIKDFLDENSSLSYSEENLFQFDHKELEDFEWLIDTSASLNVQNWLINNKIDIIPNRVRVEVAYKGQLGLIYIEGKKQNPRIDDLVNYVYFLSLQDEIISNWLREENEKKEGEDYDIVDVGIGCNSPTVIMSNDSMSFHASIFSKILNSQYKRKLIKNEGLLGISYISENGMVINSENFLIPEFMQYSCQNNSGWEIRILPSVIENIENDAIKYRKKETGGVLIGNCNYKTKTVHVFDVISAPSDSKHSVSYFFRGINNLPESVKRINDTSGGMIGYIGEWHTHPMGLDKLSSVDLAAVEQLKPLNDKYPIPTFISILSKDKFLPFIFD